MGAGPADAAEHDHPLDVAVGHAREAPMTARHGRAEDRRLARVVEDLDGIEPALLASHGPADEEAHVGARAVVAVDVRLYDPGPRVEFDRVEGVRVARAMPVEDVRAECAEIARELVGMIVEVELGQRGDLSGTLQVAAARREGVELGHSKRPQVAEE